MVRSQKPKHNWNLINNSQDVSILQTLSHYSLLLFLSICQLFAFHCPPPHFCNFSRSLLWGTSGCVKSRLLMLFVRGENVNKCFTIPDTSGFVCFFNLLHGFKVQVISVKCYFYLLQWNFEGILSIFSPTEIFYILRGCTTLIDSCL